MSTTQTSHEPTPRELGHASGDADVAHGAADRGDGHAVEPLGPVDVRAWGALVLGIAAGLLVVLCLVITQSLVAAPTV